MSANIIPILWRPDAELIIYHRSEINIYCVLSIYSFGLKISNNIIALGLDDNLVSQACQGYVGWRGRGGREDEERSRGGRGGGARQHGGGGASRARGTRTRGAVLHVAAPLLTHGLEHGS